MKTSLKIACIDFSNALIFTVAIISVSVAINAQGDTTTRTNTGCMSTTEQTSSSPNTKEKQQAALKTISEQVNAGEVITGHFEQRKFISILPQPLFSKGHFQLNLDSGLAWSITEPLPSHMIVDDKGIRQSQNGQQLWQISNDRPSAAIIGQLIRAALSFDWPVINTHFAIDICSNQHPENQQWQLTLVPKDKILQQVIRRINLEGNRHLEALILFEANNDRTEIVFQIP